MKTNHTQLQQDRIQIINGIINAKHQLFNGLDINLASLIAQYKLMLETLYR